MYVLLVITVIVFSCGAYRRIAGWKRGTSDDRRFSQPAKRLWILIQATLLQKKVFRSPYPGIFHAFFFYSFIVLTITTAVIALDYDVGSSLFKGIGYLLLSFFSETAGCLILIGVTMALWRRHRIKPETLDTDAADTGWLVYLALIVVTGFLVEGLRIAGAKDHWSWLSPIGHMVSTLFAPLSMEAARTVHRFLWWTHAVLSFAWLATLPFTKFFHVLVLPLNAFFSRLTPAGELTGMDLDIFRENQGLDDGNVAAGIGLTSDLTWKQRMDLDACVSCGRCEAVCPATVADPSFSPKKLIGNLRDLVRQTEMDWTFSPRDTTSSAKIIGNAFDKDFAWSCRTCGACEEECPAYIEDIDKIVDIRRQQVMMESRFPHEIEQAFRNMEIYGDTWGMGSALREDWSRELELKPVREDADIDILYWVGCAGSFDSRAQRVAVAFIKILQNAGIKVGILGAEENCCGDYARRTGNEYLFQVLAKKNIEALNKHNIKKIVATCPHGYNTIKNEYPQLGGNFEIFHATAFLEHLIDEGKLSLTQPLDKTVTYHDPCYLGRHSGIYQAPRKILSSIPGLTLVESAKCEESSYCCGAGGGHFWMGSSGQRVNDVRTEQLLETSPDAIATGCPYCLVMLEDGIESKEMKGQVPVKDVVEMVFDAL